MEKSPTPQPPVLSLPYLLRLPIMKSEQPPLLLMFHGYGSNAGDPFGLAADVPPEFLVISLQAPLLLAPEQYAWFQLDWSSGSPTSDPKEAEVARLFVRACLDEVLEAFDVDITRIFLLGFSQGAILSLAVALTFPGLVKGVVLLSGKISPETKLATVLSPELSQLSIFMGHGTTDPIIPISLAYELKEYLETLDVALTFQEYPMGHTVSGREAQEVSRWLSARLISLNNASNQML